MNHREIAARAVALLGGSPEVEALTSGMSSTAWAGRIDGVDHVIRVPAGDGLRPTPDYDREAELLADLVRRGVPVAPANVVDVDGHRCSVAPRLLGRPVEPVDWTPSFVDDVADTLVALHATTPGLAVEDDLVRRFHLARSWPFDGLPLDEHPVTRVRPNWVDAIRPLEDDITEAASGPLGAVHTDLHAQHLLVDDGGRLAGLLDLGDSVGGVAAWDLACLRYYHGTDGARLVATAMGERAPSPADVDLIAVAFGLYKLAKTPERADVLDRVERLLNPSTVVDIPRS